MFADTSCSAVTGSQWLQTHRKQDQRSIRLYLVAGCKTPASEQRVWDCFMSSPCARGREEVLFGWASDSDEHRLPDGVAYSVGPSTGILDVVLQVGYMLV